jgi:hypothetical protein
MPSNVDATTKACIQASPSLKQAYACHNIVPQNKLNSYNHRDHVLDKNRYHKNHLLSILIKNRISQDPMHHGIMSGSQVQY